MTSVNMDLTSGVQGLPAGVKEIGQRVDFKPNVFVLAVETKGYRIAWSRGALCPCAPVNDQTQQPDPNCTICRGSGFFYFAPALATVDELKVGTLTSIQKRIVNDEAAVIRSIMTGIGTQWQQYDPIGSRMEGTMNATVRHENQLGYHDRITNLDSIIVYQEILDALDPNATLILKPRYPIVTVNLLRSETTVFTSPTDFTIDANGDIAWVSVGQAPAKGTRLVLHYLCHPTWLVVEWPHSVRLTPVKQKKPKPLTPLGDPIPLPIQAIIKYEFLPDLRP